MLFNSYKSKKTIVPLISVISTCLFATYGFIMMYFDGWLIWPLSALSIFISFQIFLKGIYSIYTYVKVGNNDLIPSLILMSSFILSFISSVYGLLTVVDLLNLNDSSILLIPLISITLIFLGTIINIYTAK